jgi:hypothetical protein
MARPDRDSGDKVDTSKRRWWRRTVPDRSAEYDRRLDAIEADIRALYARLPDDAYRGRIGA